MHLADFGPNDGTARCEAIPHNEIDESTSRINVQTIRQLLPRLVLQWPKVILIANVHQ